MSSPILRKCLVGAFSVKSNTISTKIGSVLPVSPRKCDLSESDQDEKC